MASGRLPGTERPYFTPGFPLALPLTHRVRIKSFDGPPTATYPPIAADPIVSDTGELAWHVSKQTGMVTVDTDRTQALIGFMKENPKVDLKNLSVDLSNGFATVVLSSTEAKPISRASLLLMTTGSRVANTGMVWNASRGGLSNQGGSPTLIEPVSGKVTLRDLRGASSVVAYPLDGSGNPIGVGIVAEKSAAGWTFPIGETPTTWYRIAIKR